MPDRRSTEPPIPLSKLGELAGWNLTIRCGRCHRRVMVSLEALAGERGADLALWRLVARLSCRGMTRGGYRCGGKPGRVTLVLGRERRKDFRIYKEVVVLDDRLRISD